MASKWVGSGPRRATVFVGETWSDALIWPGVLVGMFGIVVGPAVSLALPPTAVGGV